MKLSDFVLEDAVIAQLEASDRLGVIREMAGRLAEAMGLDAEAAEAVTEAAVQREKQGTTGFGRGVAVPHVKHEAIPHIGACLARSSGGIDFSALDRAPVYIVVLLLSPPDHPDQHLAAMENIFRHLQQETFRRYLRRAQTAEDIYALVQEADELPTE